MDILQQVISQFFISFYQITDKGTVLAQIGSDAQNYFIGSDLFLWLQIISAVLCAILVIFLFNLMGKMSELNKVVATAYQPSASEPAMAGPMQTRWNEIVEHIGSNREGEWKYAVIEADKLVDDQLKSRYGGETMGERLRGIEKTQLVSIDGLWEAHKIRNRLAHDVNYFLRHAEALKAIKLYEQTLKELGIL